MSISKTASKSVILVLVAILALTLTGCADDTYVNALNPALDNFNAAQKLFDTQVGKLNQDNTLLSDATWQSDTKTALAKLDKAGKAFASLPAAPDRLKAVDGLVKQVAFEANTVVTLYTQLIDNQDMTQLDAANPHVTNIANLIGQINDEIDKANK
jgi:hypothetical protein